MEEGKVAAYNDADTPEPPYHCAAVRLGTQSTVRLQVTSTPKHKNGNVLTVVPIAAPLPFSFPSASSKRSASPTPSVADTEYCWQKRVKRRMRTTKHEDGVLLVSLAGTVAPSGRRGAKVRAVYSSAHYAAVCIQMNSDTADVASGGFVSSVRNRVIQMTERWQFLRLTRDHENSLMQSVSATRRIRLLRTKKKSEKPAASDHTSSNPIPGPDALLELKLAFEAEIRFGDTVEPMEAKLSKMQDILDRGSLMRLKGFVLPKTADPAVVTTTLKHGKNLHQAF
ncbi:uncharacterized protein LOC119162424 isoform X3 [Rhipicephalus microplus]|uniref:uncharacterized protein LOC119162424 isoform X3 n=1 Tax=Rhipicephalus microplus TaxID=6941 RepID=UPI003F6CD13B